MAEDFHTGVCNSTGGSWWNPQRSASFDEPTSIPCSTATADIGARASSWTGSELIEAKARSCDESAGSASGSSITFQETHKVQHSDVRPSLIDSSMPSFSLPSSSMNWTQALLNGGRHGDSFHAMLQEDLGSRPYIKQDPSIDSNQLHTVAESSTANPFSDMNKNFFLEQHQLSSGNESSDVGVGSYHIIPTSYGCSSMMLQDLLESETKLQQSIYDNRVMNRYQSPMIAYQASSNELCQPSWAKFSQLLKSSLSKQQSNNQSQFTNNTPFWNASAAASVSDVRRVLCSPSSSQLFMQPKTICSNLTAKMNPEGIHDSRSSSTKKTGSEPAIKKSRIETPSPLPTFKVRKEKLGDRITALQQLVSPFGKTDTASVLQEAIEYIKFLHDQVGVLSSPYLKNGNPMQQKQISDKSNDCDEPEQDLRSRGLCLVPITNTYPVASETTADFWHPTFGGTFR